MTTLVAERMLDMTDFYQNIRRYKSSTVSHIRLHILKTKRIDVGYLRLAVKDGTSNVGYAYVSIDDINQITDDDYWHGFVTFEFEKPLFLSVNPTDEYKEFTLVFTFVGYGQVGSSGTIEICRDYEKNIRNTIGEFRYPPLYGDTSDGITADFADQMPYGYEIYTLE